MNAGRPTLDKKSQTLKLRLNDAMRDWVEGCACGKGVSMSEYIRELIRADMGAWLTVSAMRGRLAGNGERDRLTNFPEKQQGAARSSVVVPGSCSPKIPEKTPC